MKAIRKVNIYALYKRKVNIYKKIEGKNQIFSFIQLTFLSDVSILFL